jgi:predicted metalloprotease
VKSNLWGSHQSLLEEEALYREAVYWVLAPHLMGGTSVTRQERCGGGREREENSY